MNDKISIYDHLTGETILREMTDEEQAQRDAEVAENESKQAQAEAEAEALRATKIAAYQKLGLSEAEIEALLPSTKPTRPPLE